MVEPSSLRKTAASSNGSEFEGSNESAGNNVFWLHDNHAWTFCVKRPYYVYSSSRLVILSRPGSFRRHSLQ